MSMFTFLILTLGPWVGDEVSNNECIELNYNILICSNSFKYLVLFFYITET